MQSGTTVSSAPVELQEGTAGNSTIYTNGTSALVSVDSSGAGTDVEDYVDNNSWDEDGSADKGTHSNFTAQKYGPDLVNDTLTEENTGGGSTTETLRPNAVGTYQEWNLSDSTHYGATSDQLDTSYIYTDIVGERDIQNLQDPTFDESDTINWVQINFRAYASGSSGPEKAYNTYRTYSTDYQNQKHTITRGAWNDYLGTQLTVNPSTSSSWTKTEITNLETGSRISAIDLGEEIRISEIWVIVNYSSPNYELDLEVQWTNADYDEANEQLCIYGGTMGAENITVDVWNGSGWENVRSDLNSGWNNVSVTSYLTTSNFTIRFKGGNETGDTTQTTWDIDAALLHVWTVAGGGSVDFNYVLNMTEKDGSNWTVRLTAYDQSNIARLDNLTIYIYDGSNSTQIIILSGAYNQQTGPWYDLNASDTEYIWMHVETSSAGTSYIYAYLEIRVPNKTVYARYIITFKIT